jgi:hypothetical protein
MHPRCDVIKKSQISKSLSKSQELQTSGGFPASFFLPPNQTAKKGGAAVVTEF